MSGLLRPGLPVHIQRRTRSSSSSSESSDEHQADNSAARGGFSVGPLRDLPSTRQPKKRLRASAAAAPARVSGLQPNSGLHRLGELELSVQLRHELVHLKDWDALLDMLEPDHSRADGGLPFKQLFRDFEYFGGHSKGALVPSDAQGSSLLQQVCTFGSARHQQTRWMPKAPENPGNDTMQLLKESLYALVWIRETSPRKGVATVGLYVSPGVLSGAAECWLAVDLLQQLWPQAPQVKLWVDDTSKLVRMLREPLSKSSEQKPLSESSEKKPLSKSDLQPQHVLQSLAANGLALEEAVDPPGLGCQLYDYQRESLHWMRAQEQAALGVAAALWFPVIEGQGVQLWYSPLLGRFTCERPERDSAGGLLCDDMGLGKTVEIIALVLSSPSRGVPEAAAVRGTLVVCPVSLVGQWKAELQTKATGLRVGVYYGKSRPSLTEHFDEFDVVLSTYGVVMSEYMSLSEQAPLLSVVWHRVVLDESHQLRKRMSQVVNACCALRATNRWCVTATPWDRQLAEVEAQLLFLRVLPATDPGGSTFVHIWDLTKMMCQSKQAIGRFNVTSHPGLLQLVLLLRRCVMRHGKERAVQLPPSTRRTVKVQFNDTDQAAYNLLVRKQLLAFKLLTQQEAQHSHFRMSALLMPLQQLCAGGEFGYTQHQLTHRVSPAFGGLSAASVELPTEEEASVCPICYDSLLEATSTCCNHWFCWECINTYLSNQPDPAQPLPCPCCRAPIARAKLRHAKEPGGHTKLTSSSKLEAVALALRKLLEDEPEAKVLVFGTFRASLAALCRLLKEQNTVFETINGSMSQSRRAKAIDRFLTLECSVFLLSLRAAACGLNLTAANHVYLLEPILNSAVERQAIGRVERTGQQRTVTVHQWVMESSIEERLCEVYHRPEVDFLHGALTAEQYKYLIGS